MAEKSEEGSSEKEQATPLLRTPTSEEKRLRAKENLERAKRVLAESGQQLHNNQSGSRLPEQEKKEATDDEKE